ncbi:hypothetical protein [Acidovorax sp. Leaf160]|uniref:hypothetical protein n=1 Tax=Acidovorax sp. Leaf160 TaxID=1736280 RepID=UPI0006F55A9C|nr:hypothetical protein [Acidovorax sp. Leaf160]KQR62622.1 hypothetical protein ASF94_15485 [Acidovorax sp. Leaf160]
MKKNVLSLSIAAIFDGLGLALQSSPTVIGRTDSQQHDPPPQAAPPRAPTALPTPQTHSPP